MGILKNQGMVLSALLFSLSFYAQGEATRNTEAQIDEIIANHIEALGGQHKIKAIDNLFYRSSSGFTMSVGRPYYKLVGDKNNPDGYMEGYDGSAWEWFEDPGVVIRTVGEASEAIRHYAGVESPLMDYAEKGSEIELVGETNFDNKSAFLLKLVRRDGFIEKFYIDTESFLIVASSYDAPPHAFGNDITTLTRFSDYRDVEGVMMAHRLESVELRSGRDLGSVQWSITANETVPADWFSPPKFTRTEIQGFVEHLYNQRDDFDAIMWTYHEFRRAHKNVDTSDALNVVGYQMLKMGQIQNAVLVLEQNVIDNPTSSNSRFGLGRAYLAANEKQKAKLQFMEALRLDPNNKRSKLALERL